MSEPGSYMSAVTKGTTPKKPTASSEGRNGGGRKDKDSGKGRRGESSRKGGGRGKEASKEGMEWREGKPQRGGSKSGKKGGEKSRGRGGGGGGGPRGGGGRGNLNGGFNPADDIDPYATLSDNEEDDYDSLEEEPSVYEVDMIEAFEVGMDIGVLLKEVHQNTIRVLTLIDVENVGGFGDHEMVYLAQALSENTSVLTLQVRSLPLTDASLVPLCECLEKHPTLRALDLSGTKGHDPTAKALIKLVRRNVNILHVLLETTTIREVYQEDIELATRHNCLWCPDPRAVNPYESVLLADFAKDPSAVRQPAEEEVGGSVFGGYAAIAERKRVEALREQLGIGNSTSMPPPPSVMTKGRDGKQVKFREERPDAIRSGIVGQQVCGDYMRGSCRYGSRCVHYHPERTTTTVRRIEQEQQERDRQREAAMGQSEVGSTMTAATSQTRIQRAKLLRASKYKVDVDGIKAKRDASDEAADDAEEVNASTRSNARGRTVILATAVACGVSIAAALVLASRKE